MVISVWLVTLTASLTCLLPNAQIHNRVRDDTMPGDTVSGNGHCISHGSESLSLHSSPPGTCQVTHDDYFVISPVITPADTWSLFRGRLAGHASGAGGRNVNKPVYCDRTWPAPVETSPSKRPRLSYVCVVFELWMFIAVSAWTCNGLPPRIKKQLHGTRVFQQETRDRTPNKSTKQPLPELFCSYRCKDLGHSQSGTTKL